MTNPEPPPTDGPDAPSGPWLTRTETAERLRVSLATVDRYARDKHLTAYRLPGERGDRRFREADVDALLSRGDIP